MDRAVSSLLAEQQGLESSIVWNFDLGPQDDSYRRRWEAATDEILDRLVAISPGGLTFVGQRRAAGNLIGRMEHLACYFPGNMALGAASGAVRGAKAAHYLDVAANLTYTCWQMYERTASGKRAFKLLPASLLTDRRGRGCQRILCGSLRRSKLAAAIALLTAHSDCPFDFLGRQDVSASLS